MYMWELNTKWRCMHKDTIPFEFSPLMYMLPKGNITFKQVQVSTIQGGRGDPASQP